MKYLSLLILTTVFYCSCENTATSNEVKKSVDTIAAKPLVGNDMDTHGCKASAGYTWSEIKQDCIRIWENGVQLKPIDQSSQTISNATILISDDHTKAELFIVDVKGSLILNEADHSKQLYKNEPYELMNINHQWILKKNDQTIYTE